MVNLLIKICIIPVKVVRSENTESESLRFKYRSKQTLTFLFYQLTIVGTTYCMIFYGTEINTIISWFNTMVHISNNIDFMSFITLCSLGGVMPTFSIMFCKHLTFVKREIVLSKKLQLPNRWKKLVLCSFLHAISQVVYLCVIIKREGFKNDSLTWWPFSLMWPLSDSNA